jgi:hypothetical protein
MHHKYAEFHSILQITYSVVHIISATQIQWSIPGEGNGCSCPVHNFNIPRHGRRLCMEIKKK